MKTAVFLMLVTLMIVNTAFAEWELVATSPDGKLHAYIDGARIKREKSIVSYWYKQEEPDDMYTSLKAEINCKTLERREHDSYEYNKNGDVVKEDNSSTPWKEIVPESVNDLIYKRLCKK